MQAVEAVQGGCGLKILILRIVLRACILAAVHALCAVGPRLGSETCEMRRSAWWAARTAMRETIAPLESSRC